MFAQSPLRTLPCRRARTIGLPIHVPSDPLRTGTDALRFLPLPGRRLWSRSPTDVCYSVGSGRIATGTTPTTPSLVAGRPVAPTISGAYPSPCAPSVDLGQLCSLEYPRQRSSGVMHRRAVACPPFRRPALTPTRGQAHERGGLVALVFSLRLVARSVVVLVPLVRSLGSGRDNALPHLCARRIGRRLGRTMTRGSDRHQSLIQSLGLSPTG